MTSVREKISQLNDRLIQRRAEAVKIGAVYKFVLEGADGGTFIIDLKDDVGAREGDGPAPCTLRLSTADGIDLLEGRANGQALFFSQRLKVEGDMGLALKLSSLMDILK